MSVVKILFVVVLLLLVFPVCRVPVRRIPVRVGFFAVDVGLVRLRMSVWVCVLLFMHRSHHRFFTFVIHLLFLKVINITDALCLRDMLVLIMFVMQVRMLAVFILYTIHIKWCLVM